MPRIQRKRSETGYYHVMIRGNERRNIFYDEEDKNRFMEIIIYKKQKDNFYLPAFCLMDNHVHLLIGEGSEDIAKIMKKINVSYVYYFNNKYNRVGHLFQDRFRSEVIENESYLISLVRYIHQNPVKAGIVKSVGHYKWSSYNSYIMANNRYYNLIDKKIVLEIFSQDLNSAKKQFMEFMEQESEDNYLDLEFKGNIEEVEAKALLTKMLETKKNQNNMCIPDEMIIEFKEITNLSIRKIAQITGLNKNKINRILRRG